MSPSGLHSMRLMVERYCVTPCTLYRGGVLLNPQPTMRDGSCLRCRIKDDKQTRIEGADATQTMMRWLITLPNSVDVRDQDHLRARDREYVLAPIANPDSDSPRNKCYAYALYTLDANGNPSRYLLWPTPCAIQRNTRTSDSMGGFTDGFVTISPDSQTCRIGIQQRTIPPQVGQGRIESDVRWLIYFQPGTDVRAGDQVIAFGAMYAVTAILGPVSFGLEFAVEAVTFQ